MSAQTNGAEDDLVLLNRQQDNNGCSGGTDANLGMYAETYENSKEDIVNTFGENTRVISK